MAARSLVLLVSILPFLELRGSIPLGLSKGLNLEEVFFLSICANTGIVVPLLFFFNFLIKFCKKLRFLNKVLSWWFNKVEKKHYLVEKYGFWGLLFFVAVPLPGSGAWSGCLAASLFKVRFLKAFLAIALGILIAGVLVSLLSTGAFKVFGYFTLPR